MTTQSPMTLDRALHLYSVDIETWWDGTGDTDQMLGEREWIEDRFDTLTDSQKARLLQLDERVIEMASRFGADSSWDVAMIRRIAQIAQRHHMRV